MYRILSNEIRDLCHKEHTVNDNKAVGIPITNGYDYYRVSIRFNTQIKVCTVSFN